MQHYSRLILFLLLFGHLYESTGQIVPLQNGLQVQKISSTTLLPKSTSTISSTSSSIINLPICGSNQPVDSSDGQNGPPTINGFAKSGSPHLRLRYQPSHIGVLPDAGGTAFLTLTENGTIPKPVEPTIHPEAAGLGEFSKEEYVPSPVYCSIKLESCPSCLIELQFDSPSQHFSEADIDKISKCDESNLLDKPCFDIEIIEERAEQSIPYLATLAGAPDVYSRTSIWSFPNRKKLITTGNSVLVVVALRNVENDGRLNNYIRSLFPMRVLVHDNTEVKYGQPSQSIFLANQTSIGFIESPRYPESYPRSVVKNYTLVNVNTAGYVRLIFDDFHVHFQSELKIIDSDGQELFNTRSEYRRPPALLSRSNKLTIIFQGHDFTQLVGFRARYEFVEDISWPDKPTRRNCDDYLEGYGGRISFDAQKSLVSKYVDCIWLIGRFPALSRTFDKIYLKVEQFQLKGAGLRLEVRRGPSSSAERVLMLFDEQTPAQLERKQPMEGLITEDSIQPAFYVRLRGYLAVNAGLSIVYTQFYRWATALCPGGDGEFHCDNSKCIKSSLQCDGYDHCGDSSDEVCHIPDPNYDNPRIDIAGALTLVIGAIGIVVLLLTIVAIMSKLYRSRLGSMSSRRATVVGGFTGSHNAAMAHEAYCNELAPSIQTIGDRRFYVLPDSQISIIEAPPTYDDALKHPRVPSARSRSAMSLRFGYANEGFRRSRNPSPEDPPAPPARGASAGVISRRSKQAPAATPRDISSPPPLPTSPPPESPRPSSSTSTCFPTSPSPEEAPRPSSSRSLNFPRSRSSEGNRRRRRRHSNDDIDDESWV